MTIRYHDVSHFQGLAYQPTGPTAAKATEGGAYTDPAYAGIKQRTLAGGWPFIAYHFMDHGIIPTQVNHVRQVVGAAPLMLDVESEEGQQDPTIGDVINFIDGYNALGGRCTLLYLPHWFWSGHWGSPSLQPFIDRHMVLISSAYTAYSDSGPGWAPYGGMTPRIWQYTADPLDTNAFKGTVDELAWVFANGSRPTPPPDVPVETDVNLTDVVPDSGGKTVAQLLVAGASSWDDKPWGSTEPPTAGVALQRIYGWVNNMQASLVTDADLAALKTELEAAGAADVAQLKTDLTAIIGAGGDPTAVAEAVLSRLTLVQKPTS